MDGSAIRVAGSALLAALDAADGEPVGFVEVGHGLIVLTLAILNDQSVVRVVSVHRKPNPSAVRLGIPEQPVKAVLTAPLLAERLVAHPDDVGLVAGAPAGRGLAAGRADAVAGAARPVPIGRVPRRPELR